MPPSSAICSAPAPDLQASKRDFSIATVLVDFMYVCILHLTILYMSQLKCFIDCAITTYVHVQALHG